MVLEPKVYSFKLDAPTEHPGLRWAFDVVVEKTDDGCWSASAEFGARSGRTPQEALGELRSVVRELLRLLEAAEVEIP